LSTPAGRRIPFRRDIAAKSLLQDFNGKGSHTSSAHLPFQRHDRNTVIPAKDGVAAGDSFQLAKTAFKSGFQPRLVPSDFTAMSSLNVIAKPIFRRSADLPSIVTE
jgi:hypothetical protein